MLKKILKLFGVFWRYQQKKKGTIKSQSEVKECNYEKKEKNKYERNGREKEKGDKEKKGEEKKQ